MGTSPVSYNVKAVMPRNLIFYFLIILLLTACTSQAPADLPAGKTGDDSHAPVILRVVEREETKTGKLTLYKDIYFTDPDGDATTVVNKLISLDPEGGIFASLSDDIITASMEEQKQEALVISPLVCGSAPDPLSFTVEDRIRDQAGNLSEPVILTFSCPATRVNNTPYLIIGLVISLCLLVGAWLFFRRHPSQKASAGNSLLLFFGLLFPLRFMHLILHEGGHAISDFTRLSSNLVLYVHPFAFPGYSRPMFEANNVWSHAAGAVTALLLSLVIFIPLWKHRSIATLPFVMLFPWTAINDGMYIASVQNGDFYNIMRITGLPAVLFMAIGLIIVAVGAFFFFSLLPLCGLAPNDKKALFLIPASMFLWGVLSKVIAYYLVPGSAFAVRWHLAGEINSPPYLLWYPIIGGLLALIYTTLYHRFYQRLPARWQTETASLTWRDLRIPGLVFIISVILGLVVIL